MDAVNWTQAELAELEADGLLRRRLIINREQWPVLGLEGGQQVLDFGSNNYLGLAGDPRLVEAAHEAATRQGAGAGASPLLSGYGPWHAGLEQSIAEFEGTEAALLFPSGFAANLGTIPALVSRGDIVFSDAKNHASIIDGCRLSRAEVLPYRHADCAHLEELLAGSGDACRRLIVTDGLFSMDGDLAPLENLAELAQRYDAMLMVDEAHATGVFGRRGRGVSEHLGVAQRVTARIGTLSKAVGSIGGFACGSRELIDLLVQRARSYVFSTALPAGACAASQRAIEAIRSEGARRGELLARATTLKSDLVQAGWQIGATQSQIIPLLMGDAESAVALSGELLRLGFYVPAIRPPSVAMNESRLRVCLSWAHDAAMIDRLKEALQQARSTLSCALPHS
jgi:8-amino-7-oxononanoate synthase